MIYRFYNGVPDNTVKYVETILSLIGNIKEFEIFKEQEDTPYVVIENGEKKRYTFVLKDDNDNEFWLYTLCGYGGSGPYASLKILQLLGLKENFNVCVKGNTHIKRKNLKPVHKLNLLVAQDKSSKFGIRESIEYKFVVSIDFKYAYQRYNFIKTLKDIGYLDHVIPQNKNMYDIAYVFDDLVTVEYEYYYYIDNIFHLNPEFRDFSIDNIKVLVEELIKNNGGTITHQSMI